MFYTLKRNFNPTTVLLIIGFTISLLSILIGVSSINSIVISLSEMDSETPIYQMLQNSGLSLAVEIYLFSIANCLVVTNYWIIAKGRDMAIFKAFGWSNGQLVRKIVIELSAVLSIGLCIGSILLALLHKWNAAMFSVKITPFFLSGTLILLLLTLAISTIVPVIRILKIHPAKVVS